MGVGGGAWGVGARGGSGAAGGGRRRWGGVGGGGVAAWDERVQNTKIDHDAFIPLHRFRPLLAGSSQLV